MLIDTTRFPELGFVSTPLLTTVKLQMTTISSDLHQISILLAGIEPLIHIFIWYYQDKKQKSSLTSFII